MAQTTHRTARIALRLTRGQARRCFRLLVCGGDVWAWVIDCNAQLRAWGLRPVVTYKDLCRELTGGRFGELDSRGARSVLQRYSVSWFEAARRRARGERAGFPRRKRRLMPLRYYNGTFAIDEGRVRLPVARGCPPLSLRLSRPPPYPVDAIRSVTLLCDAGKLCLDVTAQVPVTPAAGDGEIAGVDLGIIHPYAVAGPDDALLVSGRALRAEERLHLEDTKRRAAKMGRKTPRRGQRGSRRYRKLRARQRQAEARHRRRIRQAHHEAANEVVSWARAHGVSTLVVGDPKGITDQPVGRRHNLRLRQWRRTHLANALKDKAELSGIAIVTVDERQTSSTCPRCRARVTKPNGRNFFCSTCGFSGHRDLVGAHNIAVRGGGTPSESSLVTHRRAGSPPARRDRRRHLYDRRRSCPAPGRPGRRPGSRSSGRPRDGEPFAVTASQLALFERPARIGKPPPIGAKVS